MRRLAVIVPLAAALLGGAVLLLATITPGDDDLNGLDEASNTDRVTVEDTASNTDPTMLTEVSNPDSAGTDNAQSCTVTEEELEDWDPLMLVAPPPSGEVREEFDSTPTLVEAVAGYVNSSGDDVWQVMLKMRMTRDRVPPDSYYHDDADYEGLELASSDGGREPLSCFSRLDTHLLQKGVPNDALVGFTVTSDPTSTPLTLHLYGNPSILITQ